MDYSQAAADPALTGSSPWGSSSPRADRNFPGANDSGPDSPARPQHAHTNSQDSISANPFASEPGTPAVTQHQQLPSPEIPVQQQPHEQPQKPELPPPEEQRQQRQAARYHNQRPQRPPPAYKLQAKVTALERPGRKDPVIRFDVYVCLSYYWTCKYTDYLDKSSQIPHDPIPGRPPHAQRIRQTVRTPHLFQPRSSRPRSATLAHLRWRWHRRRRDAC
jgi:hypothetical protein